MELNTHYRKKTIAKYSRFVKPSELPPINDDDEHWISFRDARGGLKQFFSPEGTSLELDERPIHERLVEDYHRSGEVPLRESIIQLAGWLTEMVGPAAQLTPNEGGPNSAAPALAQVALFSHTVLNSTLCILQPSPDRGREGE